ncbi:MAG TPA: L,D-transpeptidase family protein [Candidatus Angelobacter sp.]|nr:L,D-transpeptidase family protein [Candidatus Angelobacter sp.]
MERNPTHVRTIAAIPVILFLFASAWCAENKTPGQADRIVIVKSDHRMTLYRQGKVLKTYKVALGQEPLGPKTRRGDHRTPEGLYTIDSRNPYSQYHLGLHISYPNAADRARAAKLGVNPGGDVMIHGLPPAYAYLGALHRQTDWTWGCIAVTDAEIEEIWSLVPVGTTVEIKP